MIDDPPKVVQVVPHENHTVTVYFCDGKTAIYDARQKLNHGVFQKLKEIDFFINNCRIMNDTLAWDLTGKNDPSACIDIDPDYLYSLASAEDPMALLQKSTDPA